MSTLKLSGVAQSHPPCDVAPARKPVGHTSTRYPAGWSTGVTPYSRGLELRSEMHVCVAMVVILATFAVWSLIGMGV